MIETRLLSAWDGPVGSVALIALIVLSFCVMVRAVKPGDMPRHLDVNAGIVILLIILPRSSSHCGILCPSGSTSPF